MDALFNCFNLNRPLAEMSYTSSIIGHIVELIGSAWQSYSSTRKGHMRLVFQVWLIWLINGVIVVMLKLFSFIVEVELRMYDIIFIVCLPPMYFSSSDSVGGCLGRRTTVQK